jgi:hypothetical protein
MIHHEYKIGLNAQNLWFDKVEFEKINVEEPKEKALSFK